VAWLSGSADLYQDDGRRPFASINFVTAHDGFTLRDLVSYEHKHNEANGESNRDGTDGNRSANYGVEGATEDQLINATRQRQLRNLLTTLFLSAGVPMIVAGDEFGRTQQGNNNAYCQDNEISWLDWDLADWQRKLLDFAKQLGQLRRAHPVFRQRTFFSGTSESTDQPADLVWFTPAGIPFTSAEWDDHEATTIGMYRAGTLRAPGPHGEVIADTSMLLLLNSSTDVVDLELPKAPYGTTYRVLLDTASVVTPETMFKAGAVVVMPARSAVLLDAN
jgi:isoamylase